MGWFGFIAAFVVFFVSHNLPLRPPIRARLVDILGLKGFIIAYSSLSLAILIWVIVAAGNAPYVPLWHPAPWQYWVPLATMAVVCLLLCFGIARPNPLSFGGRQNDQFDPTHPGIVRWAPHPLLLALALWAGAHMLPNGDLAHVILFGVFAGFALIGMRLVDRRKRRDLGVEHWEGLRQKIATSPLIPTPASWPGCLIRLALAVGLYGALLVLHPIVLNVSPLP